MPSPLLEPLLAIGTPLAATLLAGGALWRLRRAQPAGTPQPAGWEGAALALALGAGLILVRGWHGLPPPDVNDWPTGLAILAAGLAMAAASAWRWFASLALLYVAIVAPLILRVPLRSWSAGEAALWLPALGLPWLLLICAARGTAARLPDAALPAWGAALAVSALLANNAGSSSTAQHLGGAAAALGIWAVLRLVLGEVIRPAPVAVAVAAVAPLWWLLAHTLTDNVPAIALAPLAVAPLAAWLVWPLRQHRWPAAIAAALLAGGLAAVAFLLVNSPPPTPGW